MEITNKSLSCCRCNPLKTGAISKFHKSFVSYSKVYQCLVIAITCLIAGACMR